MLSKRLPRPLIGRKVEPVNVSVMVCGGGDVIHSMNAYQ